jgi:8-oxo-dGTP pyrophosphatase MutT (NUDIX family)
MPAPPDRAAWAAALEHRLLAPAAASALRVAGPVNAAVLVPVYRLDGEIHVVFTRRRDHLRRHPGEVSFPGGRHEPGDADLVATALRETHEEIGLAPEAVRLAGALRPTPTIATGYAIYPFVGIIEPATRWTISPDEVASVLELTLTDLRAGYDRRRLQRRGLPVRTDTFVVGDELIWGATARILQDLLERIDPAD